MICVGAPPEMQPIPETIADQEVVHEFDDYDLAAFMPVASRFGQDRYGFVVTPNVDHLIRYHEDAAFRENYRAAEYVLLDSRFASYLLRVVKGVRLRVCTGSDLTAALLSNVITPTDRIVLIGGGPEQAEAIATRYRLTNLQHYNPPMGFIKDLGQVEECLRFIESRSPFRFCFLAVGSPQQEAIAQLLQARGNARGLALCVGASLNFITGSEKRAPVWMRRLALEWLYRLIQNPQRMAGRYLVRGPRFFSHLRYAKFMPRTEDGAGKLLLGGAGKTSGAP
jgi:exopolysaccharide biosynthesis WecB/TagA/CpsF family protein